VVQYDIGRCYGDKDFEALVPLDKPDPLFRNALGSFLSNCVLGTDNLAQQLDRLHSLKGFQHPGLDKEDLFEASYRHTGEINCLQYLRAIPNRKPTGSSNGKSSVLPAYYTIRRLSDAECSKTRQTQSAPRSTTMQCASRSSCRRR